MGNDAVKKINSRVFETLEKVFFALFLFSIPLQTRLTFITQETHRYGFFNEYATFFLYLSDILIIITLFLFFVNPVQKFTNQVAGLIFLKTEKSLPFDNTTRKFSFGVNPLTKRVNFSKILKTKLSTYPQFIPILAFFLLIAWGFLSISWSEYKEISFFKSLKLAEFGLLLFYITQRLRWFGKIKLLSIIFAAGFFQSIIGILQYLYQHSLGLKILGESILAPNIDNVAKIVVDGEKIIRAYGTFPHPNIFAGFLILSIFSGLWLLFTAKIEKNGLLWIGILTLGIILQFAAFILTFSRVAWLTAFLILIIFLLSNTQLFHVKQLGIFGSNKAKMSVLAIIFISFSLFLALNRSVVASRTINFGQDYRQTIGYRSLYNNIAIKMIKDQPLTGIGNGNFTLKMADYSLEKLKWWQYQPAHNIYLLIMSELGIIGLILFLVFISSVLKMAYVKGKRANVSRETITFSALNKEKSLAVSNASEDTRETILLNRLIFAIFIGFLFIGLFDHYFWTLQQGQLTFWLVLGVLISLMKARIEEQIFSA